MANNQLAKIFRLFPSEYIETFLLYIPLLFLIFPQESGFFIARSVFWIFPFLFYWVVVSKSRSLTRSFKTHLKLVFLFLVSCFLSLLVSADLGYSVIKMAEYLGIFIYSIYFYFIVDSPKKLAFLTNLLIATGMFLVLLSVYFQIIAKNPSLGGINLFYPNHGHNHIASFMLLLIPIVLTKIITYKQHNQNIYLLITYYLLLITFFTQLLLSFSRAAYLILPFSVGIIFWQYRFVQTTIKRQALMFALISFPTALLIAIFIFSLFSLHSQQLSQDLINNNWLLRQTIKPLGAVRFAYWGQAIDNFVHHPILGYGPGTFRLISKLYRHQVNEFSFFAHNSLLEILAEQGISGLLAFVWLLFYCIKTTQPPNHPTTKSKAIHLAIYLGIINLFLISLLDFEFDFLIIFTLFFSVLAILLRFSNFTTTNKPKLLSKTSPYLYFLLPITIFTFIFGILFTVSSTISMVNHLKTISSDKTLAYDQIAIQIFPFEEDFATRYINSLSTDPSLIDSNIEKSILFFHRENPNIYQALTNLYQDQPDMATQYLERTNNLDQANESVATQLVDYYLRQHKYQQLIYFYLTSLQQHINTLSLIDPKAINHGDLIKLQSLDCNLNPLQQQEIISSYTPEKTSEKNLFYSIFLYNYGKSCLDNKQQESAIFLWKLSTELTPWSEYFHTELAALYYSLGNKQKVYSTLKQCQKFQHPRSYCQKVIDQIDNYYKLDSPGYLSKAINELY